MSESNEATAWGPRRGVGRRRQTHLAFPLDDNDINGTRESRGVDARVIAVRPGEILSRWGRAASSVAELSRMKQESRRGGRLTCMTVSPSDGRGWPL